MKPRRRPGRRQLEDPSDSSILDRAWTQVHKKVRTSFARSALVAIIRHSLFLIKAFAAREPCPSLRHRLEGS